MFVPPPMNLPDTSHDRIADLDTLEQLFGKLMLTARQESDRLHARFRVFVEAAPFIVLATTGADGLDASTKGDAGGFVKVFDEKTLLIPERGGNGRNDSLRNIVADPRVALTFFIPGNNDLLRVNGHAFARPPRCVIMARVDEVFSQCSRAIEQAKLWTPARQPMAPT